MRSCVADCGILIYGMFERVRFRRTFTNIPNAPKGSTPLTSTILLGTLEPSKTARFPASKKRVCGFLPCRPDDRGTRSLFSFEDVPGHGVNGLVRDPDAASLRFEERAAASKPRSRCAKLRGCEISLCIPLTFRNRHDKLLASSFDDERF